MKYHNNQNKNLEDLEICQYTDLAIYINNKNYKNEKNAKKYKKILAICTLIGYTKRAVA